ncbi:MAG: hypothetical protein PUP46_09655 [Endozoicomonas sp. (ex Botrylloides leachii)]|nr:hypothetical protein [Endozoicomonas sp. (ex Botrylloides leachii)]
MSLIVRFSFFFILSIYHSGVFADACNDWCKQIYKCKSINDGTIYEQVVYPENYDALCKGNIFYAQHVQGDRIDKEYVKKRAELSWSKRVCQKRAQCTAFGLVTGACSFMNYVLGAMIWRGMHNCCLTCNPSCCGHPCMPHLPAMGKACMDNSALCCLDCHKGCVACSGGVHGCCCCTSAKGAAECCLAVSVSGHAISLASNFFLLGCCIYTCHKRLKESPGSVYAEALGEFCSREGRDFNCQQLHQADHDALTILKYEMKNKLTEKLIFSMLKSELKQTFDQGKDTRSSDHDDEQSGLISLEDKIDSSLYNKIKTILEKKNSPKTYLELHSHLTNWLLNEASIPVMSQPVNGANGR